MPIVLDLCQILKIKFYWKYFWKALSQKYDNCNGFLEYGKAKDNLLIYSCIKFNEFQFDKILKDWFRNTHKFPDEDRNELLLMLQKGVYSYEYTDNFDQI